MVCPRATKDCHPLAVGPACRREVVSGVIYGYLRVFLLEEELSTIIYAVFLLEEELSAVIYDPLVTGSCRGQPHEVGTVSQGTLSMPHNYPCIWHQHIVVLRAYTR